MVDAAMAGGTRGWTVVEVFAEREEKELFLED